MSWWREDVSVVVPKAKHVSALNKAGIHTVRDLLWVQPRRYIDTTVVSECESVADGTEIYWNAYVQRVLPPKHTSRGIVVNVAISDGRTSAVASYFAGKNKYMVTSHTERFEQLAELAIPVLFVGKVKWFGDTMYLQQPTLPSMSREDIEYRERYPIRAVYTAMGAVKSADVEEYVRSTLDRFDVRGMADPVPRDVAGRAEVLGLGVALWLLHRPTSVMDARAARRSLAFQEAYVVQVALARRRLAARSPKTVAYAPSSSLVDRFIASLPYTLTGGQKKAVAELERQLASSTPMSVLLQGDVGSGKTIVAAAAMMQVVAGKGQCAFLAPTEVLATQHFQVLRELLRPVSGIKVELLTGSSSRADKNQVSLRAMMGESDIVVGTHALLEDYVEFRELGLVVVDEQHRFGVDQRDALRAKGGNPHTLAMTATPIPRTLALTAFGDLDTVTLKGMPAGRAEVETYVVDWRQESWRTRVWERVGEEARRGGQVFVVCPRIEDADVAADGYEGAGVVSVAERLRAEPALEGLTVGLVHGAMSSGMKEAVMKGLRTKDIDVLVATTVIEVGIDVPNATMMVVLDASSFGIAQLHQLRGRIGRGELPGLCLLVLPARGDMSEHADDEDVPARLQAVASTRDGFALAEADARIRREGDVLSSVQSGVGSSLRMLKVLDDGDLIESARDAARSLVSDDVDLRDHPILAEALEVLEEAEDGYLGKG